MPDAARAAARIADDFDVVSLGVFGECRVALLRQILATRSFHRSSHKPTKLLTGQAKPASGEAAEARPDGYSNLVAQLRRPRRNLPGRHAAIADRDLS